ncbi:hypothetical protein PAXRUDRAFT_164963 [Paxillus rubicundulus Ve08.2h10]|uniref:Uncharacterized protein n=1 Tax=Paxillus rubicundulus Ve08.2h10 TaxID=930991 RepID=A0A0D0D3F4_9AGAM|nr:hypothetical protein PAXRUDRAFT_164963 [Paxillus rubicundulus Ve08.2h10]
MAGCDQCYFLLLFVTDQVLLGQPITWSAIVVATVNPCHPNNATWGPARYTNTGAQAAQHEWIKAVDKVGLPSSYVMVQVFWLFHGPMYSLLACSSLEAAAYMWIPETYVLFSVVTSSALLTKLALGADAAHPFQLVMLCPLLAMFMRLQEWDFQVSACLYSSQKSHKGSNLNVECKGNLATDSQLGDSELDSGDIME